MIAYIDSSCLVGLLFREPGHSRLSKQITAYATVVTSMFTQAEVMASLKREREDPQRFNEVADSLEWLLLAERLDEELARVFEAGYLRGADAFHLATALWFVGTCNPKECCFLTMDKRQESAAKALGFSILG